MQIQVLEIKKSGFVSLAKGYELMGNSGVSVSGELWTIKT